MQALSVVVFSEVISKVYGHLHVANMTCEAKKKQAHLPHVAYQQACWLHIVEMMANPHISIARYGPIIEQFQRVE